MTNAAKGILLATLACLLAPAASAGDDWANGKAQGDVLEGVSELMLMLRQPGDDLLAGWPEGPELLARKLIKKYGRPDEAGPMELVWSYRRPFARIMVFRDPKAAGQPGALLEAVPYDLAPERASALAAFGKARYDAKLGELIACAGDEAQDFLSLNLADDLARGRTTAERASADYGKTMALLAAGKSAPYAAGLRFTSPAPGRPASGPASSPK